MSKLLAWFRRHPVATAALAAAYYIVVVASHDLVQDLAYWLQRTFGRAVWAPAVAVMALAFAGWVAWRARAVLGEGGRPGVVGVVWWGSAVACGVASMTLLATNMEVVHFLQYALLALPVMALTGRVGNTVLLIAALGAFDELHQWVVLHPGWAVRYDTNDVVLNTLGGALGCGAAMVFGDVTPVPRPAGRTLAATWAPLLAIALLLGAGGPVLASSHRLALYRGDWGPSTWLTLSRAGRPRARWQSPRNSRAHYVLHPGAMLLIVVLVGASFCAVDDRLQPRADRE